MVGEKFSTGPRLGGLDTILVGKFERPLAGIIRGDFGWTFWNGPWLGRSEVLWVGRNESEALIEMDGDVVRRSEGGCLSFKRTGLGLVNVWNKCEMG